MITYYVSKNAAPGGNGSRNQPFSALEAARDAVRERIAAGLTEPVTVLIGEGEYSTGGITFDERDSGTAECPVVYRADGNVVLNGGLTLSARNFEPLTEEEKSRLHGDAREKVVRIDLTKFGITAKEWGVLPALGSHTSALLYDGAVAGPMYCELFVNDRRMTVARYPNDGFLYTGKPFFEGNGLEAAGSKKKVYDRPWREIRNPLTDVQSVDADTAGRAAGWRTLKDVWVFCYPQYMWADMSSPINRLDVGTGEMELTYVSMFGVKENAPYYFYNVFEEIDLPGEWYLDRETGVLYLYPPTDGEFADADIKLSLGTNPVIRMTNVRNMTLSGIAVTASRSHGIVADGDGITIENCTVSNVAEWGMIVSGNRNTVRGCEILHTGKGGVSVSGGDRNTLTSSENVVTDNHIHDTAEIYRTYQPAVKMAGVGVVCSHNKLHDTSHMMIGFSGNNHVIEYNEIYRACTFADDSGAIYSGRDYTNCGNVIRCNFFHDMGSEGDCHVGTFAVYCDDNNGSCTIEKNVFLRCQSALLLHGGHDMTFRNNLILEACAKSQYAFRFHAYWYWETLTEGGKHQLGRNAVPWRSEVWTAAYPHIGEYLTWDPCEEQRYPHYGNLSGNIIVNHKPVDINFAWDNPRFKNVVRDNVEVTADDISALTYEKLRELLPAFEEIPFEKIGRRN